MSRVARSPPAIVTLHEALFRAVEQEPAGAAQPFLEHRAGHARSGAREQAGRMELHHLHVAQRQAGAQRHREAVAALLARRRVVAIHRRAAAGGQQHGLRLHEHELAGAHVDHQHAGDRRSVRRRDQLDRAMLLEPADAARPHLLGEPIHDLDAGQVALVHRAVERLSGERLLVDRAVGIAVEEAAELVLELADPLDRLGHQRPGEVLVGEPLAAFDRVHEVALDRIAGCQRDVVAALDHSRAAALAQQPLDRDGDRKRRDRAGARAARRTARRRRSRGSGCRSSRA